MFAFDPFLPERGLSLTIHVAAITFAVFWQQRLSAAVYE